MSGTPSFTRCAEKLLKAFEQAKIDYMFIGGLALPAYGHIRATQDIDAAIAVTNVHSLEQLLDNLKKERFETTATARIEAACVYLLDRENLVDVEIWLKPDGVRFDQELLSRRRRVLLSPNLRIWIIGPEDFIVNKLARVDRSAQDENDVVSVLINQKCKLDREYLERRAQEFEVLPLLKTLENKIK